MTELSARLMLYGAIDGAAETGGRLDVAADVIPLYRLDRDAVPSDEEDRRGTRGWHRQFSELIESPTPDPSIEDALGELAELDRPSELDQARRLKVAWALARVLPDVGREALASMLIPLARDALVEAGAPPDIANEEVRPRALELAELLFDVGAFTTAEDWPGLLAVADERRLISSSVMLLAEVSCDDTVTLVPGTGTGEVWVARIVSSVRKLDVGGRTLDQVRAALQPMKWPGCLSGFWCDMRAIDPGTPQTFAVNQEVVGDCPDAWFHPYLGFATVDHLDSSGNPTGFELQYTLCPDTHLATLSVGRAPPFEQDHRVEVDSGKIIVAFRPRPGQPPGQNEIDVTTSKNIRFREPLPTGGVGLLACITGWADHTRMMMSGCLKP